MSYQLPEQMATATATAAVPTTAQTNPALAVVTTPVPSPLDNVTPPAVAAPPPPPVQEDEASETLASATKGERGKFLPRVRILLNKDNEELLSKLIDVLETTNCAAYRSAAVDNSWFEAFERFYDSIEVDYVKPGGKNRIHKFKAKVGGFVALLRLRRVRRRTRVAC